MVKFATNASGAMWLPNLFQVTKSSSGSVVPLAMFSENIRKTETPFFRQYSLVMIRKRAAAELEMFICLCALSLSLPACSFPWGKIEYVCVLQIKTVHFALNIGPGGRWTENASNFTTLPPLMCKDIWPDFPAYDWHKFSPNQRWEFQLQFVQSH